MDEIYLLYVGLAILALISFSYYFVVGKSRLSSDQNSKILKYIPLISVLGILASLFPISYYYEHQFKLEKEHFESLLKQKYATDSVYLTNESREKAIDSLKKVNNKLEAMLKNVQKQEIITGKNSNIQKDIEEKISNNKAEIGEIETYNKILNNSILDAHKGQTTSGNTTNFIFYCPTDSTSDFLDLKLVFHDESLINEIAYILVEVLDVKSDKSFLLLHRQVYKPQDGVNAFRVKNYLKIENTLLVVGYVLKSELKKEFPRFEKVNCWNLSKNMR